jgi:hypothetical protein
MIHFTDDELQQALRNVGYDIECGACASVFYTGCNYEEHTCEFPPNQKPLPRKEPEVVVSAVTKGIRNSYDGTPQGTRTDIRYEAVWPDGTTAVITSKDVIALSLLKMSR